MQIAASSLRFPFSQLTSKPKVVRHYANKNDGIQRAECIISEVMPECPSGQGNSGTGSQQQ